MSQLTQGGSSRLTQARLLLLRGAGLGRGREAGGEKSGLPWEGWKGTFMLLHVYEGSPVLERA